MSTITRRVSLVLLFTLICTARLAQAADLASWVPVGPGAGWGYSADIDSLTVHPSVAGSIWAGLPEGGLYRSSDQGVNWRWAGARAFISEQSGVSCIAADPSRPGALWAATRTGFFRTADGGLHWTQVEGEAWSSLLGDEDARQLAVIPGALYVQLYRRLALSSDNGQTWMVLYDQGRYGAIESFAVHPASPRILYLVISDEDGFSLLQSLDRGGAWAPVTSLPVAPSTWLGEVSVAPAAVYVTVGGDEAGILRSADQGRTWRPVLGGSREHRFLGRLVIDPRAPRTLYAMGVFPGDPPEDSGIWISRNAGSTWSKISDRTFDLLRIDSAAGVLYARRDAELWRSRDGGATWTVVLRAPDKESSFAQIAFQPGNPARRLLTVGFILYRSVNGGQSWKLTGAPFGVRDAEADPADPNRLIAVTSDSAYVSVDAGQSWQRTAPALSLWYVELLVRTDAQTLLAGGAGIFRSGDNGATWETVLNGFPGGGDLGRWTQKIEADPDDPSTVYALTFLADSLEPPHEVLSDLPSILWKSTDAGRTWNKVTLNLRTFAVDPGTSRLYGVRQRRILASDDGGATWRQVGLTPRPVHELVIDPTDSNVFYAARNGFGIWRSRDRGAHWDLVSDYTWVPASLTIDPGDPLILYGANRWQVFKIRVPE